MDGLLIATNFDSEFNFKSPIARLIVCASCGSQLQQIVMPMERILGLHSSCYLPNTNRLFLQIISLPLAFGFAHFDENKQTNKP